MRTSLSVSLACWYCWHFFLRSELVRGLGGTLVALVFAQALTHNGEHSFKPAGVALAILDRHRQLAPRQFADRRGQPQLPDACRLRLELRGDVAGRRHTINREVGADLE